MRWRAAVAATLLVFLGCFPTTVSVSPDGRIALVKGKRVIVYDPAEGKAAVVAMTAGPEMEARFAAFSPDGKKLLWAFTNGQYEGDRGDGVIYVGDPDGGGARQIYRASKCLIYATWSPDGKHVAVSRLVRSPALDDDVVAFAVIDPANGKAIEIATDTTQIHHWTPDGKSIIAFCPRTRLDGADGRGVRGHLARFDLDGKKTILAEVITTWDLCLDLSSDGKRVLMTAGAIGPPGAKDLDWDQNVFCRAYVLDLETSVAKKVAEDGVDTALFSPDDKHILCGRYRPRGELVVCKADGTDAKTLVKGDFSIERKDLMGRIMPAWLSNDTVLYWNEKERLISVKIDGTARQNVQAKLDALLEK